MGGWQGLSAPEEYGGQGLLKQEMMGTARVASFARKHLTDSRLHPFALDLLKLTAQWNLLTVRIMFAARRDRDLVSAATRDFLVTHQKITDRTWFQLHHRCHFF